MKVIILCGVPGSGKSTICKESFPEYTRISQDDLGDKDKCVKAFRKALEEGKDCIIDRCNHNMSQRHLWIANAEKYNAESIICIHLVVDDEECINRISERKGHPTISERMPLDKKKNIVYNFSNAIKRDQPSVLEGFDAIIQIRN